jgi:hypothetical protein
MTNSGSNRAHSMIGRALMESLDGLGEAGRQVIISNMQRRGLFLEDSKISLPMLRNILIELLGEQATDVLMEQIVVALDGLHNNQETDTAIDSQIT